MNTLGLPTFITPPRRQQPLVHDLVTPEEAPGITNLLSASVSQESEDNDWEVTQH